MSKDQASFARAIQSTSIQSQLYSRRWMSQAKVIMLANCAIQSTVEIPLGLNEPGPRELRSRHHRD